MVVSAGLMTGWLGLLAGIGWLRVSDARRLVSEQRLAVALQTFRPADHRGQASPVALADLDPNGLVRADPPGCSALAVLASDDLVGAASWTGVHGSPVQPVRILTVRLVDAAAARSALAGKRSTLRSCRSARLTFPPFDRPPQEFVVQAPAWSGLHRDRVTYSLVADRRYDFYVRRFGNTLTWTYGDPDGAAARAAVVDGLAGRLQELTDG